MPSSPKAKAQSSYRQRLLAFAKDHYGYVTPADARTLLIPTIELPKLAEHRGLTNLGYGIYRFDEVPVSPHGRLYEAVLRCGPGAMLADESVLEFHGLLDPLARAASGPATVVVGTTRRVRAQLPEWIELRRSTRYQNPGPDCAGIPALAPADAFVNISSTLDPVAREMLTEGLRAL